MHSDDLRDIKLMLAHQHYMLHEILQEVQSDPDKQTAILARITAKLKASGNALQTAVTSATQPKGKETS